jgi:fluoride exporter
MNIYKLLLVGAGGFLGSIARYISSTAIDTRLNGIFPYGTLLVNVIGSLILGVVYGYIASRSNDLQNLRLLLVTGFCGGFTTFSAFAWENLNLIDQKMPVQAFIYIAVSLVLGIGAVFTGIWIAKAQF